MGYLADTVSEVFYGKILREKLYSSKIADVDEPKTRLIDE